MPHVGYKLRGDLENTIIINRKTRRKWPPFLLALIGSLYYTPGSGEHGPRAAPGGVASKNGWVYMGVQGGFISYGCFVCLSVHLSSLK